MFEKLVGIICNYVEVDAAAVKPESRFMEDLGFTSFDFILFYLLLLPCLTNTHILDYDTTMNKSGCLENHLLIDRLLLQLY